jgi:hypothetical protein
MMILYDEIAAIAYELFESRGCIHGCDLDDWLNAERIVLGKHSGQEMEEPEEEETSEETDTIKEPVKRTDEEPYNEEMT